MQFCEWSNQRITLTMKEQELMTLWLNFFLKISMNDSIRITDLSERQLSVYFCFLSSIFGMSNLS